MSKSSKQRVPALVVLEDGTWFKGEGFGAATEAFGEVVFNTSMSGYQEILTDPSYRGQLVTMTAPHIGNYGVNELDVESSGVQVAGLIVRSVSRMASNWRATGTLPDYLESDGVAGITGVDTRALTRHIRDRGAMMGAISHDVGEEDVPAILERLKAAPRYEERDWIAEASVAQPMRVVLEQTEDRIVPTRVSLVDVATPWPEGTEGYPEVAVIDYGVKYSILKQLAASGCRVTVLPHDTEAADVLAGPYVGLMLSNGPGDPGRLDAAVARVRALLGQRPLFGICLGHQLLARALGGKTFKLKFGHRGPNQPVKVAATGRVQITSQNHGYSVELDGCEHEPEITYINLNDQTVEGIKVDSLRAFSVQHHPEAGPGPHDAAGCFAEFRASLDEGVAR